MAAQIAHVAEQSQRAHVAAIIAHVAEQSQRAHVAEQSQRAHVAAQRAHVAAAVPKWITSIILIIMFMFKR